MGSVDGACAVTNQLTIGVICGHGNREIERAMSKAAVLSYLVMTTLARVDHQRNAASRSCYDLYVMLTDHS